MRKSAEAPVKAVIAATVVAVIGLVFLFDTRRVSGMSMEPTLLPGQLIYINRAAYGLHVPFGDSYLVEWAYPHPGDIVVFMNPQENILVVKRCIAVAGDTLQVRGNELTVRGTGIALTNRQRELLAGYSSVPHGTVFVAGDNESDSIDSRDYGFIQVEKIIGKVILLGH